MPGNSSRLLMAYRVSVIQTLNRSDRDIRRSTELAIPAGTFLTMGRHHIFCLRQEGRERSLGLSSSPRTVAKPTPDLANKPLSAYECRTKDLSADCGGNGIGNAARR